MRWVIPGKYLLQTWRNFRPSRVRVGHKNPCLSTTFVKNLKKFRYEVRVAPTSLQFALKMDRVARATPTSLQFALKMNRVARVLEQKPALQTRSLKVRVEPHGKNPHYISVDKHQCLYFWNNVNNWKKEVCNTGYIRNPTQNYIHKKYVSST